jgi:hypothetical protein
MHVLRILWVVIDQLLVVLVVHGGAYYSHPPHLQISLPSAEIR